MELEDLPDEMLGRIFNYTQNPRIDMRFNRIYNHQQYDIYSKKYKSIYRDVSIPHIRMH